MHIETVSDLFEAWPSMSDFARDAGVTYGAAKQMRRRGSVDVRHWLNLVSSEHGKRIGVTPDLLTRLHAQHGSGAAA